MRVVVMAVFGLAIAGCAPRLSGGRVPHAPSSGASSCSTSKTMAVPYILAAAAGVAATGALWPQIEQMGEAARNRCEGCDYSMMLYAAPAITSAVAVGLGVRHLERAERCEEQQRLVAAVR